MEAEERILESLAPCYRTRDRWTSHDQPAILDTRQCSQLLERCDEFCLVRRSDLWQEFEQN
jgi:hypothetical protein